MLLGLLTPACHLVVDSDLGRIRCQQEGQIGPPACRDGESCQLGVCAQCQAEETCGDGLDNDCDGNTDEDCQAADGGAAGRASVVLGGAGAAGSGAAGRAGGDGLAGAAGHAGAAGGSVPGADAAGAAAGGDAAAAGLAGLGGG